MSGFSRFACGESFGTAIYSTGWQNHKTSSEVLPLYLHLLAGRCGLYSIIRFFTVDIYRALYLFGALGIPESGIDSIQAKGKGSIQIARVGFSYTPAGAVASSKMFAGAT
jgi:hypothetical protein